MDKDRWPKPKYRGDRMGPRADVFRLDFNRYTERDAENAAHAKTRQVRSRVIVQGARQFRAYSADDLLHRVSEEEQARPGFPCG